MTFAIRRSLSPALVGLLLVTGCSPNNSGGRVSGTGGGNSSGTGGTTSGTGGGGPAGTGGGAPGTGGSHSPGTGGAVPGSGGAGPAGTGGAASGSGGASGGTGGSPAGTGGNATVGSGGAGTGGTPGGGGGQTTGGGGSSTNGGATGNGGANGNGGAVGGSHGAGTGGTPVACQAPIPVTTGAAVTVTVDLAGAATTKVSPDLMGIHTAVYDGLLTTSTTTEQLLRAAGVTSLRYPGGSYADLYHWESHTATDTPAAGAGSNTIYVAPEANFGQFVLLLGRLGANALITVNYGMNSGTKGPGSPKEAAAWVAYANGSPGDTTSIGADNSVPPVDFGTVGYWAGLRAAAPLPVDDGKNFLRINHPAPVGIKYWELGNELYGNGYFNGSATSAGWEADLHAPYNGTNGTARKNNANLAPSVYGTAAAEFATAMKAVDSTIQFGRVVNWPDSAYAGFDAGALNGACAGMDFAAVHWYPGTTLASLLTLPGTDIPTMFSDLHALMMTACGARGATMPIAVTEWGPNTLYGTAAIIGQTWHPTTGTPSQLQIGGLFAAESYATFMEQSALAVHWAQLHDNQYLLATPVQDTPGFAYKGQLIAHYLAAGGDSMLPRPTSSSTTLVAHAAHHVDGGFSVTLTNISPSAAANVTLNVTGGALGCAGTVYSFVPAASNNNDGPVSAGAPIFSSTTGTSVPVAVPAYSVVVVSFPPK